MEQQQAGVRPRSGKIILQAHNRLFLVDQKDICFAAIEEGIISVVTPTLEGHSKCRTIEELLELLDPVGVLESPSFLRGEHQPHQGSGALVQEQLPAAHG